ncbi:MAG TPA: SpoIIIAH-like family protein [Lachnospiraceae bacterium]|nr:SpoIIIAH-like family protein [Lachnospiraceae bacterium]
MKNILKKNQLMITALAIMLAVAGYLQFAGTNLNKEEYLPASGDATGLENAVVEDFTAGSVTEDYSLDGLMNPSDGTLDSAQLTEIESLDTDANVIADDYLTEGMDAAGTEATSVDSAAVDPAAGSASVDTGGINTEAETPTEGEIPGEAVFTGTTAITVLSEARLLKEQVRAKNKETLLGIIDSTTLSDEQKQSAVDTMVQMTTIAEQEMGAEILLEAKGFPDVVVSVSAGSVDVVVNASQLTDAQRAQIEDIVKRKTNVKAENIIICPVVQ